MKPRHTLPQQRDSGAALLLAIGFVLMISAISGGLAALATSSINNRNTLELVRDRQYAADGAIQEAILQVSTSTYDCNTLPSTSLVSTLNGVAIRVDWANACPNPPIQDSAGRDYPQRNVIFSACLDSGSTCDDTDVIIRAQINFEPASGTASKTNVQSWSVNR